MEEDREFNTGRFKRLLFPDKSITNGKIKASPKNSNNPIKSENKAIKKIFSIKPSPNSLMN